MDAWLMSLVGGVVFGLGASVFLVFNGRIAGISGVVSGLLAPTRGDLLWRVVFVGGLLTGGVVLALVLPSALDIQLDRSWIAVGVAGLLAGFGARLGSGCTSGHGVCGVGRLSRRSLVATATFTASGAVAVFVVRHLLEGTL